MQRTEALRNFGWGVVDGGWAVSIAFPALLGAAVMCLGLTVATQDAAAQEVRVGVSRATFVLPRQIPLAGYSRRKGASSHGVHDPVGVRALVLHDADSTPALISCDILIVDERLFDAVRARLLEHRVPEELVLMLAATHTHSGPGGYGTKFFEKLSMGHYDPRVFDALVDTITRAILTAYHATAPARVVVRSAATRELIRNRMDPARGTDNELTVCAFYPAGAQEPIAVIVNFAAHPTTLGADNRQLSADYPGVIVRELERRFPSATCLFVAGAVGDQAPVKHGEGFEAAEWLGRTLTEQAVVLLRGATPQPPRLLSAVQEQLPLPPARVRMGRWTLPRWLGAKFVDDDATLSLIAVGDVLFLGVPCDLAASLGQSLKQTARLKGWQPMVVGFASDYIGYCLPASLYEEPSYESSLAFNGPATGELLVQRLAEMIRQAVVSGQ